MASHQVPSESSKKKRKAEATKNSLRSGIDLGKLYVRTRRSFSTVTRVRLLR